MRRGTLAAMLIAALTAAGIPAVAQVKLPILPQIIQLQKPPRMSKPPQPPRVQMIPPSRALQIAGKVVPNGKPVGVKLLNDSGKYVVTVRTNNAVTRVIVDAQTGAPN